MRLVRTEDESLLVLVDVAHKDLDPLELPSTNLNGLVELFLFVQLPHFNITFNHKVIRRVNVLIKRGTDLLHLERRQEPVVDAVLQGVGVDRLAEVLVGINVVLALWGGSQAELHGRLEVLHDLAPVPFVLCPTTVALVDHDEVKEVGRVVTEVRSWLAVHLWSAHEGLEDGEEDARVLRHLSFLLDVTRCNSHQRIFFKPRETVKCLVCEDVAIRQEEDAREAVRLAAQVPTAMEELPGDLEGNHRLAGTGGEG